MDSQHLFAGEQLAPYTVAQKMSHKRPETGPVVTDRVPVIGTLQMGDSNELELRPGPHGTAIGTVATPITADGMFALRIAGDHLYPTVRHGACLLIDPQGSCSAGEIVLVELLDGNYLVCELVALREESITIAPVQGGQRQTLELQDVRGVQCVAGVLSASMFLPTK